MDYLRDGIGLRAWAQRDPLVEYQREGFDMFSEMMAGIKEESVGSLFNLQVQVQEGPIVEEAGPDAGPLAAGPGTAMPGIAQGGQAAGTAQGGWGTARRARTGQERPSAGPGLRARAARLAAGSAGMTCARVVPAASTSAVTATRATPRIPDQLFMAACAGPADRAAARSAGMMCARVVPAAGASAVTATPRNCQDS